MIKLERWCLMRCWRYYMNSRCCMMIFINVHIFYFMIMKYCCFLRGLRYWVKLMSLRCLSSSILNLRRLRWWRLRRWRLRWCYMYFIRNMIFFWNNNKNRLIWWWLRYWVITWCWCTIRYNMKQLINWYNLKWMK